jgi:YjbE family integral membrane protein
MGVNVHFLCLDTLFKGFFLDLLLSCDNAVAIALVCRSLPSLQMRKIILFGTGAAILLRICSTMAIFFLLEVPFLKISCAIALLTIAVRLLVSETGQIREKCERRGSDLPANPECTLWYAVITVIATDSVMSLDHAVALAAVAQGNILYLSLGLVASIPLLIYGSFFVGGLIQRYPMLIALSCATLGWIAGDLAVSDPAVARWLALNAPALIVATPILGAVYVLLHGRMHAPERARVRSAGAGPVLGLLLARGALYLFPAQPALYTARRPVRKMSRFVASCSGNIVTAGKHLRKDFARALKQLDWGALGRTLPTGRAFSAKHALFWILFLGILCMIDTVDFGPSGLVPGVSCRSADFFLREPAGATNTRAYGHDERLGR